MSVKTFMCEWDTEDMHSMVEALLYALPKLEEDVSRDMKQLIEEGDH